MKLSFFLVIMLGYLIVMGEGMCLALVFFIFATYSCSDLHVLTVVVITASTGVTICGYCSASCSGTTVCTEYPSGICTKVSNECTGEFIGYGIFSQTGSQYSANIYSNTTCSGTASLSFQTTCTTCIPTMNAYAQCSAGIIVSPLFTMLPLSILVFILMYIST